MPDEICGIYAITNTITGDSYIGSSREIHNRWNAHRNALNKGKHARKSFNEAWAKYGADVFSFAVLEETESQRQILLDREQFYMNQRHELRGNHGYNEGRCSSAYLANEYNHTFASKQIRALYAEQIAIDVAAMIEVEDKWRQIVLDAQRSFEVFIKRAREIDKKAWDNPYVYVANFTIESVRQFGFPPDGE